jgi:hypothetical protein
VRYDLRTAEFDADMARSPAAVRTFIDRLLGQCSRHAGQLETPAYGSISVIEVAPGCAASVAR